MFALGGIIWGTPTQDNAGNAIANPSPIICGTMQDAELEFKWELKKLRGEKQFAVAVNRAGADVTGKVKHADIRAGFYETIVFGQAGVAGLTSAVYDTAGATIPATPFTVTPTIPGTGTFAADLGVIDVTTGRALTRVASAPTAGQYSVAAGVYTFAAADTGKLVYINFRYTATSTTARRINVTNGLMGYTPKFRLDMYLPYEGKSAIFTLNTCIADGAKFGVKNDDFTVPEFGFTVQADAQGNIGTLAFTE